MRHVTCQHAATMRGTDQQNLVYSRQQHGVCSGHSSGVWGQHRRENLPLQNECVPSQQNGMDAPMKAADPYVSVK